MLCIYLTLGKLPIIPKALFFSSVKWGLKYPLLRVVVRMNICKEHEQCSIRAISTSLLLGSMVTEVPRKELKEPHTATAGYERALCSLLMSLASQEHLSSADYNPSS